MAAPTTAPAEATANFADYRGIWVYVQHRSGEVAPVSWQLLGVAREMAAQIDVPVAAVVLGHDVRTLCEEAIAYGADTVYYVDDSVLANYRTQPYAHAMANQIG